MSRASFGDRCYTGRVQTPRGRGGHCPTIGRSAMQIAQEKGRVLTELRNSEAFLAFKQSIPWTAACCLVLTIAFTCSNGFAVDRTFNISYIAESSDPFDDTLPGAGCLD